MKATDGFYEANLIGMGGFSSVYKGILDEGEKFVAVPWCFQEFHRRVQSIKEY